jgi:deleted in liver cancer protein
MAFVFVCLQVDLAYKKVGDGHPLRVWRATTEVEAPPAEVLNRILRDQFMWDPSLAKSRVLARLDAHTEVFQFAANGMAPLVPRDFCVLR